MMSRATAKVRAQDTRPLRLMVLFTAGFLFLIAQALFAAHASAGVDDLKGHSAADCAVCLAGGVADGPARSGPPIEPPARRADTATTAIPAALLTEIVVRAASPRAPPVN